MNHRLVETHIFSFVVGRAFVTDIEKLKISSKTRCLDVAKVMKFFSEITKVRLFIIGPKKKELNSISVKLPNSLVYQFID